MTPRPETMRLVSTRGDRNAARELAKKMLADERDLETAARLLRDLAPRGEA